MAIVKALRRLAGGNFGLVGATDQIACDAGAMTVTPTGGVQHSIPDAIGARVLGDANGRVRPSKIDVGSMAANLCPNGEMEEVLNGQCVGWSVWETLGAGNSVQAFNDSSYNGTTSLLLSKGTATATTGIAAVGPRMLVEPATTYELSAFVAPMAGGSTSGIFIRAYWYSPAGSLLYYDEIYNGGVSQDWTRRAGHVKAPVGGSWARIVLYSWDTSTSRYTAFDVVGFRRVTGTSSIENAAVTPEKLFAPTRGQFFQALKASGPGRVATVRNAIPSDPDDAINIAFNCNSFVPQAGALAQFVKNTLALTDAQLAAIIAAARSVTE